MTLPQHSERVRVRVRSLTPVEFYTWAVGLAAYFAGDIVTTAVGIQLVPGVVESNAIAASAIAQLGLWPAMLALKTLVLLWVLGCWRLSPQKYRVIFPSLLAAIGILIVAANTRVILVGSGLL